MSTSSSTARTGSSMHQAAVAAAVCLLCCFVIATASRNGLYATPLALWTDVAQKSPLKRRAHLNLGHVLSQAGMFPQALQELDIAGRIPEDRDTPLSDVYREISDVYLRTGRYQDAVTAGQQGLQLAPFDARLLGNVGLGLVRMQQFDRALMYAERSYAAHPSPEAMTLLGEIHLAKGNAAQAVEYFLRAVYLSPDNAFNYWNAAVALARAGRYDDARKYLAAYMAREIDEERRQSARGLMETLQQQ